MAQLGVIGTIQTILLVVNLAFNFTRKKTIQKKLKLVHERIEHRLTLLALQYKLQPYQQSCEEYPFNCFQESSEGCEACDNFPTHSQTSSNTFTDTAIHETSDRLNSGVKTVKLDETKLSENYIDLTAGSSKNNNNVDDASTKSRKKRKHLPSWQI
jgi:hypothetical protein